MKNLSSITNDKDITTKEYVDTKVATKQDTLTSGTNIKTINNESILGSGNITIQSGGSATDVQVNGTSIMSGGVANLLTKKPYNANTNKLATVKDLTEWSVASDKDDFITIFGANANSYGIELSNDDRTRYYTIYADKTSDMVSLGSSGKIILEGNAVTISNVVTPVNGGDAVNKSYVDDAISALPKSMVFKGSLGTGGTITSLPTAATANNGFVYQVITAGTYASQAADIGDLFISNGSSWVLIPSGDEDLQNLEISRNYTSGTKIATISIDNDDVDLYIPTPVTIGNTSSTAFRGDQGATAYSHATDANKISTAKSSGLYKVAVTNEGHIASATAVTKSDITALGVPATDTNSYPEAWTWSNGTTSGPSASMTGTTSGMASVSIPSIPAASTSISGVVTTGAQSFNGVKTFNSSPKLTTNSITTSGGYTVSIPNATSTLVNTNSSQALINKTYNGYTLAAASAKGVDTSITTSTTSTNLPTSAAVATLVNTKQDMLISGTNLKTINNQSLLGSGNIDISGSENVQELSSDFYTYSLLPGQYEIKSPVVMTYHTDGELDEVTLPTGTRLNVFRAIEPGDNKQFSAIWHLYIEVYSNNGLSEMYKDIYYEHSYRNMSGEHQIGTGEKYSIIPNSGGSTTVVKINGTSITSNNVANIVTNTTYNSSSNKIATMTDVSNAVASKLDANWNADDSNGSIEWQEGESSTASKLITKVVSNTNNNFSQTEITSDNMLLTSGVNGIQTNTSINMTPYAINITNQTTDGSITIDADLITLSGKAQIATVPDTKNSIVNKKYVDDIVGDIESLLGGI